MWVKCYEVFAFCKFLRIATEMFYFFKFTLQN